jgi:AcrR family transcriptional regulator
VALHLFAERGYADTSLREIAEQLGVTKAALYFHYKNKEEIITTILRGYLDGLTALVDQAATQPPTLANREQVLRRYACYQAERSLDLTLIVRREYTVIGRLPIGSELREIFGRLVSVLASPDPTPVDTLRARVVLACVHVANLAAFKADEADEPEFRQASLTVALEILRGPQPPK